MLVPFLLCLLLADTAPAPTLQRIGRLDHPAIREASGIVASRKHPGVFWVHNDSGNPPALFAVRRDGTLIREFAVGVPNVDWEDIAVDDSGHLFLGDIGNNGSVLPLRAVYKLDEPDPFLEPKADPEAKYPPKLKAATACYYRFERGKAFDAEALVIDKARALLVAKTFDGREAEVYAIPFDPPAPLLKPAVPERIGTLPGFTKPVTGASLSRDGKRLAVCSLRAVGVYQQAGEDKWKRLAIRPFRSDDQIEAITWDGDDLILAGEERGIYRLPATTSHEPASTPSQTP